MFSAGRFPGRPERFTLVVSLLCDGRVPIWKALAGVTFITGAFKRRGPAAPEQLSLFEEWSGLDPAKNASHSLRAGCATSSAGNGAGDLAIAGRTGHASLAMVQRYVRHGNLFAVDPFKGLL